MTDSIKTKEDALARMQARMATEYRESNGGSLDGFDDYWRQHLTDALVEFLARGCARTSDTGASRPEDPAQDTCLPRMADHDEVWYDRAVGESSLHRTFDELAGTLERTECDWTWLVDLSSVSVFDLPFLDGLLATGRELRERGGHLTLSGLQLASLPSEFSDLFLRRCKEERIQILLEDTTTELDAGRYL